LWFVAEDTDAPDAKNITQKTHTPALCCTNGPTGFVFVLPLLLMLMPARLRGGLV
jgi:hypothetical protein